MPGRTAAFADGQNGTPTSTASTLAQDASVFNSKVPGKYTASSVLQQTIMSPNGGDPDYANRELSNGSYLPTSNGTDANTFNKETSIRLDGQQLPGIL